MSSAFAAPYRARFADRALMPTAGVQLARSAVALALYPFSPSHLWSIALVVVAVGLLAVFDAAPASV